MKKLISHSNNLKNLNLIINYDTYKMAHEDIGLLSRNEMRGVRMLLEITKPDLILEENKILSTIIIFGGASIAEESNTKKRIENIKELICTYNVETTENVDYNLVPNTISLHRKKHSNTLYTINALNELIKLINNGVLDTTYQVPWDLYKNMILISNKEGLSRIPTRILKIIDL